MFLKLFALKLNFNYLYEEYKHEIRLNQIKKKNYLHLGHFWKSFVYSDFRKLFWLIYLSWNWKISFFFQVCTFKPFFLYIDVMIVCCFWFLRLEIKCWTTKNTKKDFKFNWDIFSKYIFYNFFFFSRMKFKYYKNNVDFISFSIISRILHTNYGKRH